MARWQLPQSNPWARYNKLTLLASLDQQEQQLALPDISKLPGLPLAECAGTRVGEVGLPPGTLWMVDLRGAESVAFGTALSRASRTPVSLVLTFNNWPAPNGLVPAEETLAGLVSTSPGLLSGGGASTPVFLLDAWRLAYRYVEPTPEYVDNRYMLTPSDFPEASMLKAQGISQIVYVVESRAGVEHEEDDLNAALLDYQAAGIGISLVDLGWLCAPRQEQPLPFDVALLDFRFPVLARQTLQYDQEFYRRAHGGFGGVHAISSFASGIHGAAHGGG
jgi:hypothetical protein